MYKMYKTTGTARIENINKPHILVYRELGSEVLNIKGFDTKDDLREFLKDPTIAEVVKRFEEGK